MLLTKQNVGSCRQSRRGLQDQKACHRSRPPLSSGRPLLQATAVASLKKNLSHALVVTPNIPEAEVLSGIVIRSEKDMDFAAGKILDMGPAYVLGGRGRTLGRGHLYGEVETVLSSTRRVGEFHGTGCVLSSAIAVFIARDCLWKRLLKRPNSLWTHCRNREAVGEKAAKSSNSEKTAEAADKYFFSSCKLSFTRINPFFSLLAPLLRLW